MDDAELDLKLIENDLDLYKFYLELSLKLSTFVFGTTGAIVAYQQTNYDNRLLGYSLVFPFLLNLGFFYICLKGSTFATYLARGHKERVQYLRRKHNDKPIAVYDLNALPSTLNWLSFLYLISSISLVVLFYKWLNSWYPFGHWT